MPPVTSSGTDHMLRRAPAPAALAASERARWGCAQAASLAAGERAGSRGVAVAWSASGPPPVQSRARSAHARRRRVCGHGRAHRQALCLRMPAACFAPAAGRQQGGGRGAGARLQRGRQREAGVLVAGREVDLGEHGAVRGRQPVQHALLAARGSEAASARAHALHAGAVGCVGYTGRRPCGAEAGGGCAALMRPGARACLDCMPWAHCMERLLGRATCAACQAPARAAQHGRRTPLGPRAVLVAVLAVLPATACARHVAPGRFLRRQRAQQLCNAPTE